MPSWRDVQSYSVWPPYQVIERYYPFKNSSVEDFTIGVENCEHRLNGYCNGPLKPGTTYRVKIRAFSAPDKFTDTEYSFPIQTGKIPKNEKKVFFTPIHLILYSPTKKNKLSRSETENGIVRVEGRGKE